MMSVPHFLIVVKSFKRVENIGLGFSVSLRALCGKIYFFPALGHVS